MMTRFVERRVRRSNDPMIALHHQLSAVRNDASLDAVVLADSTGCVVAGAGSWPACEELAAFSPYFTGETGLCNQHVAREARNLASNTHFRPSRIEGVDVVLCAQGPNGVDVPWHMSRALSGCQRILTVGR